MNSNLSNSPSGDGGNSPSGDGGNSPLGDGGFKAMILAAGLGTRLKPFTDKHPKALAVINGKSLLQRNIEYLQRHNIHDVIVNTHHFAAQIEDAVAQNNGWGSKVTLSYEKDVLETGGGLLNAMNYFKNEEDFVLMNADVLTNLPLDKMIAQHKANNPLATLAVSSRTSSRYLLFDENNLLSGWENVISGEVKTARHSAIFSQFAFSGIHIISHTIFETMQAFTPKFSIIDVYLQNAATQIIQAFRHDDYLFVDVGKPESVAVAETMFI